MKTLTKTEIRHVFFNDTSYFVQKLPVIFLMAENTEERKFIYDLDKNDCLKFIKQTLGYLPIQSEDSVEYQTFDACLEFAVENANLELLLIVIKEMIKDAELHQTIINKVFCTRITNAVVSARPKEAVEIYFLLHDATNDKLKNLAERLLEYSSFSGAELKDYFGRISSLAKTPVNLINFCSKAKWDDVSLAVNAMYRMYYDYKNNLYNFCDEIPEEEFLSLPENAYELVNAQPNGDPREIIKGFYDGLKIKVMNQLRNSFERVCGKSILITSLDNMFETRHSYYVPLKEFRELMDFVFDNDSNITIKYRIVQHFIRNNDIHFGEVITDDEKSFLLWAARRYKPNKNCSGGLLLREVLRVEWNEDDKKDIVKFISDISSNDLFPFANKAGQVYVFDLVKHHLEAFWSHINGRNVSSFGDKIPPLLEELGWSDFSFISDPAYIAIKEKYEQRNKCNNEEIAKKNKELDDIKKKIG